MTNARAGTFRGTIICSLLCLAACVPYLQVKSHGFLVSYDDELYVTENPHVLGGLTQKNAAWAFSTFETGNWIPATWLSHMLDCSLFGLRPGAHHLVNLFFHIVNVLLLFLLLRAMTKRAWQSGLVAALFAVHPMHVESVAWISERKDVLSTMFWLGAVLCYLWYVKRRGVVRYLSVALCFVLGLLAKPMAVTLPFVLLLFDFWPLQRIGPALADKAAYKILLLEKVPLFALSFCFCIVAYVAQNSKNAVLTMTSLPLLERTANAVHSYGAYLWKMIAPVNLSCFYPLPATPHYTAVVASLFVCTALTVLALKAMRRMPYLFTGWFFYLGTLVPVIGFVQIGSQAMADRYTYVPFIGLFIIIAWAVPELLAGFRLQKHIMVSASLSVLLFFLMMSHAQAGYWKNSVTLFSHAAAVTANNDVAYLNLGVALAAQGRTDEAIASFNRALAAKPFDSGVQYDVYNNLGAALARQGKTDEAISYYQKALLLSPELAEAHFNLAAALAGRGNAAEAIRQYKEGLARNPEDFKAHENLAAVLARQEKTDEAIAEYRKALSLAPGSTATLLAVGRLCAEQRKVDDAIGYFTKATAAQPGSFLAHINLGVALAMKGNNDEAILQFKESIRINPRSAEAHTDLGRSLGSKGNITDAIAQFDTALALNPSFVDCRMDYGALLANAVRTHEAINQFEEVLRIQPGNTVARKNLALLRKNKTGLPLTERPAIK
jgi:protein O-mannosyl-transferase